MDKAETLLGIIKKSALKSGKIKVSLTVPAISFHCICPILIISINLFDKIYSSNFFIYPYIYNIVFS